MSTLYVGNLPYSFTERELEDLFSQFGTVTRVVLSIDAETGCSRGFGFVEVDSSEAAARAIEGLRDYRINGRSVVVATARHRAA